MDPLRASCLFKDKYSCSHTHPILLSKHRSVSLWHTERMRQTRACSLTACKKVMCSLQHNAQGSQLPPRSSAGVCCLICTVHAIGEKFSLCLHAVLSSYWKRTEPLQKKWVSWFVWINYKAQAYKRKQMATNHYWLFLFLFVCLFLANVTDQVWKVSYWLVTPPMLRCFNVKQNAKFLLWKFHSVRNFESLHEAESNIAELSFMMGSPSGQPPSHRFNLHRHQLFCWFIKGKKGISQLNTLQIRKQGQRVANSFLYSLAFIIPPNAQN